MGKYFTIKELTKSDTANRLGIDNTPNEKQKESLERLIDDILDPLRAMYGSPLIVTSGFRCKALNDAVKGSKTSQHLKAEASDLKPKDGDTRRLFDLAKHLMDVGVIKVGQLIWEYGTKRAPDWVHISLPNEKHHNQVLYIGVK